MMSEVGAAFPGAALGSMAPPPPVSSAMSDTMTADAALLRILQSPAPTSHATLPAMMQALPSVQPLNLPPPPQQQSALPGMLLGGLVGGQIPSAVVQGDTSSAAAASGAPGLVPATSPSTAYPAGPIQLRLDGMGLQDPVRAQPPPGNFKNQQLGPQKPAGQHREGAGASSQPAAGAQGSEPATTAVLQQIPQNFNKDDLIAHIEALGFGRGAAFDFMYYPTNFEHKSKSGPQSTKPHHGYAIVNFVNSELAQRFMALHGTGVRRSGDFSVKWANVQGFDANVFRYIKRHDRIRDPGLRPTIWLHGNPQSLSLTKDNLPADALQRFTQRIQEQKDQTAAGQAARASIEAAEQVEGTSALSEGPTASPNCESATSQAARGSLYSQDAWPDAPIQSDTLQ